MIKQLNTKALLLVVITLLYHTCIFTQGYKIKITINGLSNKTVFLGHYFAKDNFVTDDSIRLNAKGVGICKGDKSLPGGMYSIAAPPQRLFEILIDKDQEFSVETDTSDYYSTKVTKNNIDDELFVDYQKYLAQQREEVIQLQKTLQNENDKNKKKEIPEKLQSLNKKVIEHQEKLIEDHPETFFAAFLKATMEINVPDPPKDDKGNIIDSAFQYKYYRNHYFDNFDLSDPRLIRTPFFEKKLMTFFEKVLIQIPDTIIHEVDKVMQKARSSEELFRYVLIKLFNHYAQSDIMGMDAVYVHIAEKYYIPEAHWSDSTFINDLKERIAKAKPNLIGKIAANPQLVFVPKEHFIAAADSQELKKNPYVGSFFNIHDVDAKFLAIIFWASDCGHCKKSVPKLYEIYKRLKDKGFKVISLHMMGGENGKEMWVDFINKHKLYDWINAWNPYDFSYKILFDVPSTNIIYLLDEDKRLIAKRISPEQVEDIIQHKLNDKKK